MAKIVRESKGPVTRRHWQTDRRTDGKALTLGVVVLLGLLGPLSLPASSQSLSPTWLPCLSQPTGHLWGSGKEFRR